MRKDPNMLEKIVEGILQGDRRMVARAISFIENEEPCKQRLLSKLYPHTGKTFVLGVTGAPGVGKSSLVNRLLKTLRKDVWSAVQAREMSMGPVHTVFPRCVVDQKKHAQGATRRERGEASVNPDTRSGRRRAPTWALS